jgi:hypothetical protein
VFTFDLERPLMVGGTRYVLVSKRTGEVVGGGSYGE